MPDFFDEQDYKRRLIESGLDPDSAAVTARRTAEARRKSGGNRAPRPVTFPVAAEEQHEIGTHRVHGLHRPEFVVPSQPELDTTPAPSLELSSAIVRAGELEEQSNAMAKAMTLPPERRTVIDKMAEKVAELADSQRRNGMATSKSSKSPSASQALAVKVSDVRQAAVLKQTKEQMKALQLSLFDLAPWADDMRAMPNDLARAALFTTRNKRTARVWREQHDIFHVNKDVVITYTGQELRADDDELVWQQVLEYAKHTPIGSPVTFTFYELCHDVGWHSNGRYYDRAEKCLTRLQATALQFSSKRLGQLESVSLIARFRVLDRGKKNSRCQIEIHEELVVLFAGDHYSKFIWQKYRSLSPTARRMFDYFVSHKEPFPLKLETFRLMCGSDSARMKKWREQAAQACEELTKSELIESSWVSGDAIYCKR